MITKKNLVYKNYGKWNNWWKSILHLHYTRTPLTEQEEILLCHVLTLDGRPHIACKCINYCQNEWFRNDCKISRNYHVVITASVYFLSCCVQICPKRGKCRSNMCDLQKNVLNQRLANTLVQYTVFYQTWRNALDQMWSWTVTAEYESPVGLQWVYKKTGETFEHVSA